MRNTRVSNRSRPSSRTRRNRRSVNQHRHPIRYEWKIKYQHSRTTEDRGWCDHLIILSTLKRSLPMSTPEQLGEKGRGRSYKCGQIKSSKLLFFDTKLLTFTIMVLFLTNDTFLQKTAATSSHFYKKNTR